MRVSPSMARVICGALAILDVGLGGGALLAPGLYMGMVHPEAPGDPVYLLRRTGALWLMFALFQAIAFLRGPREPGWFLGVGVLRLVEVPADMVYLATAPGLSLFGTLAIGGAPPLNLLVGLLLVSAGRKNNPNLNNGGNPK
ncbi:MAG: hypothetical protein HY558_02120 [Euryarchaeota archaeon]|nr:hypothetical protein [Euryarchaeota archaeon]